MRNTDTPPREVTDDDRSAVSEFARVWPGRPCHPVQRHRRIDTAQGARPRREVPGTATRVRRAGPWRRRRHRAVRVGHRHVAGERERRLRDVAGVARSRSAVADTGATWAGHRQGSARAPGFRWASFCNLSTAIRLENPQHALERRLVCASSLPLGEVADVPVSSDVRRGGCHHLRHQSDLSSAHFTENRARPDTAVACSRGSRYQSS